MKTYWKKTAALILSASFVAAMAGCGGSEPSADSGGSPAATDSEKAKPALTVLHPYFSKDLNTLPSAKVIEEKTGYKVTYDMLPNDKPEDKLNLIMGSGQEYDYIKLTGSNAKNLFTNYAKQGALVDLGPLIDQYGPNIKNNIDPSAFEAMKVDGKIYGIPSLPISINEKQWSYVSTGLVVRQDWLDKLGLAKPQTLDEFTAMLQAFKDKDPGGNGAKNIPLTLVPNATGFAGLAGAFGYPLDWSEVDGQLVPQVLTPRYKEIIAYMADLYQKGLLDVDYPTNKLNNLIEKLTGGRTGVAELPSWSYAGSTIDTLEKNVPGAKLEYLPYLTGKDGKAGVQVNHTASIVSDFTVIPKTSKHAADAIKFLNAKMEEETFRLYTIGEENKHYTVKDGKYYPILPIFFDDRGDSSVLVTGVTKKYGDYWQARLHKDERTYNAFQTLNTEYAKFQVPNDQTFDAPLLDVVAKNTPVLNQMVTDYAIKVILKSASLDTFDDFIKDWKAKGGDAVVKQMNEWYAGKKK
ncbi:MAG: family 1 extracellular solute-binding protein [Paenibacillaceae bacterium]|jgi:putative aldouronate transport system substrate-binding protein|nr:family 1 extracellular solute-binding protein [Paenibacillaceae bacterium]